MDEDLGPNLFRRKGSAQIQLRKRVPADVVQAFGKAFITESLGTSDRREADRRKAARLHILEEDWAKLRRAQSPRAVVDDLDQATLAHLYRTWHAERLKQDAEQRIAGTLPHDPEGFLASVEWESFEEAARNDDLGSIAALTTRKLSEQGISAPVNSEAHRKAARVLANAWIAALQEVGKRGASWDYTTPDVPPAPSAPTASRVATGGPSMDDLRKRWETQEAPEESSRAEARTAVRMLDEVTGRLSAPMIEKRHIIAFRESRKATGIASATVQKQLNLLRPIFRCATDDGIIKANPMDGVKAPKDAKDASEARTTFEAADLVKLFGAGVYLTAADARTDKEQAQFWIPLLALWTGARQSELVQLLTADVGTTDGHTFIHITTGAGKRLKTKGSKRRVPVHQELVACGFIRYVNEMRTRSAVRLFPGLDSAPGRAKGASFSQWFTRHRRDIGLTDSRKVFHSLRHGFKDACRASDIPAEHHDRMTGHGGRTVGDSYGAEYYPLKPLAASMAKLQYAGLDLSHLHFNAPIDHARTAF